MHPEYPKKIGIWEEQADSNGTFIRNKKRKNEYMYWADMEEFPAKSDKKRVVLLGESVARGYFYDPYYTPAKVLEHCMQTAGNSLEVLDMAMTSLTFTGLMYTINDCLKVNPDAIVIFAGNNWLYADEPFGSEAMVQMGNYFTQFQFEHIKGFVGGYLSHKAAVLFKQLAFIQSNYKIPVTFIIPEVNLLDWKSSSMENIIILHNNGQTYEWASLYRQAEEARENQDFKVLENCARKMIEIDPSIPYSFELMASCKLHEGETEDARAYLHLAKETAFFGRTVPIPATYLKLRNSILFEAQQHGVNVIDVPRLLEQHSAGQLPGRRFFLDYCHLTDEGIRIVMAATAAALQKQLQGSNWGFSELLQGCPLPSKEVACVAFFYAAIHNAHYGQGNEIVYYLCKKAISQSASAINLMKDFVDFSSRKTSNAFCTSYESFAKNNDPAIFKRMKGLWHKSGWKLMDVEIVQAMVEAMKSEGIDLERQVMDTRHREHSVQKRKANLLESFYSCNSYNKFSGHQVSYYEARSMVSEFNFIAEANTAIRLDLVYRIAGKFFEDEPFEIEINNGFVEYLPIVSTWTNIHIDIPGNIIKHGVNKINIKWPVKYKEREEPEMSGVESIEDVIDKAYHTYGEIFNITAC